MSTQIEFVDTPRASEATLLALHELYVSRDAEELPDDPPMPVEQRLVEWRHLIDTENIPRWALWEGAEVVATAGAYMDREQNLENGFGWVYVRPDHRGRGLSRVIAEPMLDAVQADGRVRFAVTIKEGRPEEAIPERAGMKAAYREKRSRLAFREIDWDLMASWVARAQERARDYEVLFLPTPIEDRHVESFCELTRVMNTAPREDYEEEDEVLTPEIWRDIEAREIARGNDILTYVAVYKPSGAFAGYTNVAYHRYQPDLAWQWDTGVDPAHRNKGLGRWVKAAMALKLREEYPELERIDTYNAGSNEPMLNINVEMGFKPILVQKVWQGDLTTIRERLSV